MSVITVFKSVATNKCPRCHQGDFWPAGPYKNMMINGGNVYSHCDHCGLKYEKENGFWYGSMYVSYAIGVATIVAFWVATLVLFEEMALGLQLGIIVGAIILLAPFNYWLSRLFWINFFVGFDPSAQKSEEPIIRTIEGKSRLKT